MKKSRKISSNNTINTFNETSFDSRRPGGHFRANTKRIRGGRYSDALNTCKKLLIRRAKQGNNISSNSSVLNKSVGRNATFTLESNLSGRNLFSHHRRNYSSNTITKRSNAMNYDKCKILYL